MCFLALSASVSRIRIGSAPLRSIEIRMPYMRMPGTNKKTMAMAVTLCLNDHPLSKGLFHDLIFVPSRECARR